MGSPPPPGPAVTAPWPGLSVSGPRLMARLAALAEIGDTGDGGCARLALTDEDQAGRDLVVSWMDDLSLDVAIDGIGNVVATQRGFDPALAPVMCGSHIDTVRTGGRYDGNFGVLAGLEVIESVQAAGIVLGRPLAVAFFTDEEGARFAPDMLGSLAYAGGIGIEDALDIVGIDGATVGAELERIGYAGGAPLPGRPPHAFVEVHVEQGPVLEAEGVTIGAVTGVQGISWQELTISGQSNHAGTTPMHLRHDAGYAAFAVGSFVRELVSDMGGAQVGTVGKLDLFPDLVNVVAGTATLTVDLRNTDAALLEEAEGRLAAFVADLATREGVTITSRTLARFDPVAFDPAMIDLVESTAVRLGHSVRRMPSGAGHDAQMMARIAPTSMVFVPSVGGISHNPAEFTSPEHLLAGAEVLAGVMCHLATVGSTP
ncbi:MAG: Zn-dependent hydrolase [Acidimicrobiales bacterium]